MKRTLGSLLALAGLALVWLPLASAQLSLDTDTKIGAVDETVHTVQGALPPINLNASPIARLSADGSARLDLGTDVDSDAQTSQDAPSAPAPAQIPLDSPTGLAAAGTVTGLALLAGLAAYHWGSLKILLAGGALGLFSRIDHNKMLDNEVRHRVHEAVANNPGVTIKEVTMLVGCGWGTAVYHLKRLEGERLVVSERNRQYRRYFRNGSGISNDSKGAFSELKNPTSQRIARTLLTSPGACQKDLCHALGLSPPLASKYLGRMVEAGLVNTEREWKTVKYFPTPRLEDLLELSKPPASPVPLAAAIAA